MRTKLITFLLGFLFILPLLGINKMSSIPPANKFELKVIQVEGVWKVVDASDYTKTKVKVKKNTTIVWTAEGTDVSFQFPDFLFDPVSRTDSLANGYTKFLKNGKKLKLKIRGSVMPGTYEYAVYCTSDGVFAVGGSPPKIIVE